MLKPNKYVGRDDNISGLALYSARFVRYRSIIAPLTGIEIAAPLTSWNVPYLKDLLGFYGILGVMVIIFLGSLPFLLAKRREIQMADAYHLFRHNSRENFTELYESAFMYPDNTREGGQAHMTRMQKDVDRFFIQLVDDVALMYAVFLGNPVKQTHCAIRRADKTDNGQYVYRTYYRSKNLGEGRPNTTEDIDRKVGIVNTLLQKEFRKPFIINDMNRAEKENLYRSTLNDRNNPEKQKRLLSVPIMGYDLENNEVDKRHPLGILFVGSGRNRFLEHHAIYGMGVGDLLGLYIPVIFDLLARLDRRNTQPIANKDVTEPGADKGETS